MKKMRVYVRYDDRTKTHYYRDFRIVEEIPQVNDEIIKVEKVDIDCENSDSAYDYDYYKITTLEDYEDYVCFNWKEQEDELILSYENEINKAKNKEEIKDIVRRLFKNENIDDLVFSEFIDNDILNKLIELGVEFNFDEDSTYEIILKEEY